MLIKHRLRSASTSTTNSDRTAAEIDSPSSSSSSTSTSQSSSIDHILGECYLCQQQKDSDGRKTFITCTICAHQFHLKCLNLKSKHFHDMKSRVYKQWVCRKCRRCLLCRQKRIGSSQQNNLLSSLRSHPERKLNSLKMITCIECDCSIHLACFYRQQNRLKLSLSMRELRKKLKNFLCPNCSGESIDYDHEENDDEVNENDEIQDEDEEEIDYSHSDNEDEEVDDEDDEEEENGMNDHNNENSDKKRPKMTKQDILRIQLRKLGIDNPDKLIEETIKNGEESRPSISTRSSRRNNSSANDHSAKPSSSTIASIDDQKNLKRKNSESESSAQQISKKSKCDPPVKQSSKSPDQSPEPPENDQTIKCPVSDCDSLGHLSGEYPRHSMRETCPLYHNQTADECRQRYEARIERQQQQRLQKKCWSSPRKSNQKTFGLIQHRNPKWTQIMNQRNAELKQLQIDKVTYTANRQPKLDVFSSKFDLNLFLESQSLAAKLVHENSAVELYSMKKDSDSSNEIDNQQQQQQQQTAKKPGIESIVMGKYEISVWYQSQYSCDEYQNCCKLFICEYCLKCMNYELIYRRHRQKCTHKHPPGNEIYRKGRISIFEIDGAKQKEYCQNLCLLAKLFLEYKTLFIDVEPFLFYIMTEYDEINDDDDGGMHIIGYFSKEKYSINSYNVSCILTLPQYQRSGYGRMLIQFSYLLTRIENKIGSPEKPLSDFGIISYRSYWKFILMDYLSKMNDNDHNNNNQNNKEILLKDISHQTGINTTDLISTLQLMGILKYWKGKHLILINDEQRKKYQQEIRRKRKLYGDKMIDPKCLHWKPSIYPKC